MAVGDILIAPATVYRAPYGEALPSGDTIDYGEAWGGNWVNVGYTLTPVSVGWTQELFELEVEQETTPVISLRVKQEAMIETTLAELTGANLNLVLDGVLTTVVAGAGVRGKETVKAGGKTSITNYAWGFEGFFKLDTVQLPVRVFLYKATANLNGQLQFGKRVAAGIPLQVKGLTDTTKTAGQRVIEIQKITAKATDE